MFIFHGIIDHVDVLTNALDINMDKVLNGSICMNTTFLEAIKHVDR